MPCRPVEPPLGKSRRRGRRGGCGGNGRGQRRCTRARRTTTTPTPTPTPHPALGVIERYIEFAPHTRDLRPAATAPDPLAHSCIRVQRSTTSTAPAAAAHSLWAQLRHTALLRRLGGCLASPHSPHAQLPDAQPQIIRSPSLAWRWGLRNPPTQPAATTDQPLRERSLGKPQHGGSSSLSGGASGLP